MSGPKWVDISSFSQRAKDRTPRSFELKIAGLRLIVTRHFYFAPDVWVLTCEPWFNLKQIGTGTADEAMQAAWQAVREKVEELLAAFASRP